jgi:hypothetical protein
MSSSESVIGCNGTTKAGGMRNLMKVAPSVLALCVVNGVPFIYDSPWWYLLSWIPGVFTYIILDDVSESFLVNPVEKPKKDLEEELFNLEQELEIPSKMRFYNSNPSDQDYTDDISEARMATVDDIGTVCAFWNDGSRMEFYGILHSVDPDNEMYRFCDKFIKNKWEYCSPIQSRIFIKK